MAIYYIGDGNGRVKIGYSHNPQIRLKHGRCWCPELELLVVEPGEITDEQARHQQFSDEHIELEWFKLSPKMQAHIEGLKAQRIYKAIRVPTPRKPPHLRHLDSKGRLATWQMG